MSDNSFELSRLRWRCRRGTKELDLLLLSYFENHYELKMRGMHAFQVNACIDAVDYVYNKLNKPITIADIGDSIFTANVNTPFHSVKMVADETTEDSFTLLTALSKIKEKLSKEGANDTVSDGELPFAESIGLFKCKFYRLNTGDTSKASEENTKHRTKQLWIRFGDIVDGLCNKLYCLTSKHTRAEANGDSVAPPIAMLSISGRKFGEKPEVVDNPEKKEEDVDTVT